MILFLLYVLFGALVTSCVERFWDYTPDRFDIPKIFWSGLIGLFWPFTGPALGCYILSNKLLDKITKV